MRKVQTLPISTKKHNKRALKMSTSSAKMKSAKDDAGEPTRAAKEATTTSKKKQQEERSASVPPSPFVPYPLANMEKVMTRGLLEMEVRLKQEVISKVVPLNEKVSLEISSLGKEMAKNFENLSISMSKHDNGIKTVLKSLTSMVSRLDKISREQESIRRELDAIKRSITVNGSPVPESAYYGVEAQYVRNTTTTSYAQHQHQHQHYQQQRGGLPGFQQAPVQLATATPPSAIPHSVYQSNRRNPTARMGGGGRGTPYFEPQQPMAQVGGRQRRDTPRPYPYRPGYNQITPTAVPIASLLQPTQPTRQWTTRGDGIYTSDEDGSDDVGPSAAASADKSSREEEVLPPPQTHTHPASGAKSSKPHRGQVPTEVESKINATLAAMASKSSESAVVPSKSTSSTSAVQKPSGGFGGGRRGKTEEMPASGPTAVDTSAKEQKAAPGGFGAGRRGKSSQPNQVPTRPLTMEELSILAMASDSNRDSSKDGGGASSQPKVT